MFFWNFNKKSIFKIRSNQIISYQSGSVFVEIWKKLTTSNKFPIAHMLKIINFLHIITITDRVWYETMQLDQILKIV
jgi:hypothetical protein